MEGTAKKSEVKFADTQTQNEEDLEETQKDENETENVEEEAVKENVELVEEVIEVIGEPQIENIYYNPEDVYYDYGYEGAIEDEYAKFYMDEEQEEDIYMEAGEFDKEKEEDEQKVARSGEEQEVEEEEEEVEGEYEELAETEGSKMLGSSDAFLRDLAAFKESRITRLTLESDFQSTSSSSELSSFDEEEKEKLREDMMAILDRLECDREKISRPPSFIDLAEFSKKKKVSKIHLEEELRQQEMLATPPPDKDKLVDNIMMSIHEGLRSSALNIFEARDKKMMTKIKNSVAQFVDLAEDTDGDVDVMEYVANNLSQYNNNVLRVVIKAMERRVKRKQLERGKLMSELPKFDVIFPARQVEHEILTKEVAKLQESLTSLHLRASKYAAPSEIQKTIKLIRREVLQRVGVIREMRETIQSREDIDLNKLLTESEINLPIDEELAREMEEFIKERVKEIKSKMMDVWEKKKVKSEVVLKDSEMLKHEFVTLKFKLNDGKILTRSYTYYQTFAEVKCDLSQIFRIPAQVLWIHDQQGDEAKNEMVIKDLKVKPRTEVIMRLSTKGSGFYEFKSEQLEEPESKIIRVKVETGRDENDEPEYEEVDVEVVDKTIRKPYIGGYRDRQKSVEYHHATTQTGMKRNKRSQEKVVYERDTQTVQMKTHEVANNRDNATQMWRSDYFVSTLQDKIITSKLYVDSDQADQLRDMEGKIKTIQRYIQAYIARKFVKEKCEEYDRRQQMEEEARRDMEAKKYEEIRMNILNMTYPNKKEHFEMLYAVIEKWRIGQTDTLNSLKTEGPKRAEMALVLEKEIEHLKSIEKHRRNISEHEKKKRDLKVMKKTSKPITWTGYKGMTISMDTIKTQRAREMMRIYQELQRDDIKTEGRIDLLMSLKYGIDMWNTNLTNEIQNLINRECDLLLRGFTSHELEYLRRRIEHLMMLLFKQQHINPEIAKHMPKNNKEEYRRMRCCKLCGSYDLLEKFCPNTRQKEVAICCKCGRLFNISITRIDYAPYRKILKHVQAEEMRKKCYSSTAYLLQDLDIFFLIKYIWHEKSCLSGDDNIYDLRLARWDKDSDWTPWNCVLLGKCEVKTHESNVIEEVYDELFIKFIKNKHLLARQQFRQLMSTDERMRDSGVWANVVDRKVYKKLKPEADIIYDDDEDLYNYTNK